MIVGSALVKIIAGGVIVGSALVKLITESGASVTDRLSSFTRSLKGATQPA